MGLLPADPERELQKWLCASGLQSADENRRLSWVDGCAVLVVLLLALLPGSPLLPCLLPSLLPTGPHDPEVKGMLLCCHLPYCLGGVGSSGWSDLHLPVPSQSGEGSPWRFWAVIFS